jgi:hypothetical protein
MYNCQAERKAVRLGEMDRKLGRPMDPQALRAPFSASYRRGYDGRGWSCGSQPTPPQAPVVAEAEAPPIPPAWAVDLDGAQAERTYRWQTR